MEIRCKKCGKLFGYETWGTVYPGGKEKEDIDCPYCGENNGSEMISNFIRTYKLDDKLTKKETEQMCGNLLEK